MDIARAIESELTPGLPPVLVLEGARTSGKTYVARKRAQAGIWQGFESLADPATYALAQHDLPGWLESLPATCIIDEAQLLTDLPLHIKRLVDEPGARRHFLLTGSARIGRSGLGGSDPLTGRVRRWNLSPFSAAELGGNPGAMLTMVDRLFSGHISDTRNYPPADISRAITQGGFPLIALGEPSQRSSFQWIRDMTLGLVTDNVLPSEKFDAATALRVLDGLLRNPGGILNTASLSQRLDINARTVDRYLDILQRRFLLTFLPNLATNPTRQTRARSKVHAVDVAFAAESLVRSNPDTLNSPEKRGALFETYVANQILASVQFSPIPVYPYYWRHAKTAAEVDIVLVDTEGRMVGIEVKFSSQVSYDDATGLRALTQEKNVVASYVIYPGDKVVRLDHKCWALPVTALS